jgi:2-oxoglutarate ferredoxin oxidoreductase subunit beta
MLKAQKATMQTLESLNHNPADRLAAMDLAQAYGEKLYTGVFFRHPEPGPTFEQLARERQESQRPAVKSRADVLNVFRLKQP